MSNKNTYMFYVRNSHSLFFRVFGFSICAHMGFSCLQLPFLFRCVR